MRWGSGTLRWVRPLHAIVCTFDGEAVALTVDGIAAGNTTRGHRFMAPAAFPVRRFEDYAGRLKDAFVMVDSPASAPKPSARKRRTLAFAQGFEVVEDEALIAETAGLAEWPVVLMGSFDEGFLDLPPEVISTTLKHHQKCFSRQATRWRPRASASLANRYLLVANLIAEDGGKRIVEGNNRVIAARLADARFFWDQDRKTRLEDLLPKLEDITFHGNLGSQRRTRRAPREPWRARSPASSAPMSRRPGWRRGCARSIWSPAWSASSPNFRASWATTMPSPRATTPQVAEAIRDHYKPQGPSDTVPASPVAQAVALADKLDMLVGFWAIGEKPTGSKDPYALRRAALGINQHRAVRNEHKWASAFLLRQRCVICTKMNAHVRRFVDVEDATQIEDSGCCQLGGPFTPLTSSPSSDRLKVYLRDARS
jgi:glycyl-tRNA synthetase beta chain